MKIAVFSDIQGNLAAMESVVEDIQRWSPDLVVMNGDLVNRGPLSHMCLEFFEQLKTAHGWLPVRGNHEDYIEDCALPAENPLEMEMRRFADWTRRQLGDRVTLFKYWPDHLILHPPGSDSWMHITHASMAGNRLGISESIPDKDLVQRVPEGIAIMVTAHTHKALHRYYHGTEIVNVGSAGSPFDQDVRASYGRFQFSNGQWLAEIRRLDYDRSRADNDFYLSGFLDNSGPLGRIIYQEWKQATLLMPAWKQSYREAVRQGRISLANSVSDFLSGAGLQ